MCVYVSRPIRPMNIVTFLRKNADTQKNRVVDIPRERDRFRNKIMKNVEDFDEKSYNHNGKPWKSSRILRVKPNFFIFSLFIIFRSFFLLCFSLPLFFFLSGGSQNLCFCGCLNFVAISLHISLSKNSIFRPDSGCNPFRPLFIFSFVFFSLLKNPFSSFFS